MSATEIQEVFLGKPGSEFSKRNWIFDGGAGGRGGGTGRGQFLPPGFPSSGPYSLSLPPHSPRPNNSPNHHYPKCPLSRRGLGRSLGLFQQPSSLLPTMSPMVPSRCPLLTSSTRLLNSRMLESCIGLCTDWALCGPIGGNGS